MNKIFYYIIGIVVLLSIWSFIILPLIDWYDNKTYRGENSPMLEEVDIDKYETTTKQILSMIISNPYNPNGYQLRNMVGRDLVVYKLDSNTYKTITFKEDYGTYFKQSGKLFIKTEFYGDKNITWYEKEWRSVVEQIKTCKDNYYVKMNELNYKKIDTCYIN